LNWLADENFPVISVLYLRDAGIDVAAAYERCRGCSDEDILELAHRENRGVLTFDRDFGEMVFSRQLACPPAVMYFRFRPRYPEEPAEIVHGLLGSDQKIAGYFLVLDRGSFRRRQLPTG